MKWKTELDIRKYLILWNKCEIIEMVLLMKINCDMLMLWIKHTVLYIEIGIWKRGEMLMKGT